MSGTRARTDALPRRGLLAGTIALGTTACARGIGSGGWREVAVLERAPGPGVAPGGGLVTSLAWSPDGARLAVGAESATPLDLWDVPSRTRLASPPRTQTTKNPLAFTRDGRHLVAVTAHQPHGRARYAFSLLDARTGELAREVVEGFAPESQGGADRLALSGDGRWLAALFTPNVIAVYDTRTWSAVGRLGLGRFSATALAISPDGARVAVCGGDFNVPVGDPSGSIGVWDWRSGHQVYVARLGRVRPVTAAWSPDGLLLALGLEGSPPNRPDGGNAPRGTPTDQVHLLGAPTGAQVRTWRWGWDEADADALDWSPDGALFAVGAGGRDGAVRLLAPGTDGIAATVGAARPTSARAVAFSPDGRMLAHGDGGRVRVLKRVA